MTPPTSAGKLGSTNLSVVVQWRTRDGDVGWSRYDSQREVGGRRVRTPLVAVAIRA
jgi:hypothetical protein